MFFSFKIVLHNIFDMIDAVELKFTTIERYFKGWIVLHSGYYCSFTGCYVTCKMYLRLQIGDRFITRKRVQKFYDKALAIGLTGYAKL